MVKGKQGNNFLKAIALIEVVEIDRASQDFNIFVAITKAIPPIVDQDITGQTSGDSRQIVA